MNSKLSNEVDDDVSDGRSDDDDDSIGAIIVEHRDDDLVLRHSYGNEGATKKSSDDEWSNMKS